jgi:hypothetical protein
MQIVCSIHPASYPMDTREYFPGGLEAVVKNPWSLTSTLPQVFISWCLAQGPYKWSLGLHFSITSNSSGLYLRVVFWLYANVSEEHAASIFRVEANLEGLDRMYVWNVGIGLQPEDYMTQQTRRSLFTLTSLWKPQILHWEIVALLREKIQLATMLEKYWIRKWGYLDITNFVLIFVSSQSLSGT